MAKHAKKLYLLVLVLILILCFTTRLYRFDNPIADWHSWRQAETSSVSRNFVKDGFDLLHPRMDNISNVQSGFENPQGYFFVEFPLYNAVQAIAFKTFGIFTIEQWGRLVSIFSSTLAALFLYLLVSRHSNKKIGLLSAAFYALTPFNIYFGRTILADTSMVMALLGGTLFFDLWISTLSSRPIEKSGGISRHKNARSTKWYEILRLRPQFNRGFTQNDSSIWITFLYFVMAILLTALAFLLKPFALFFTLPMLYLAFAKFGLRTFIQWQLWLFAILAIAPLVGWRIWMMQFPEGIPVNAWLFNGNGIRFRPSFFRWIFYERLTILISGYFGMIFFLLGLYKVKLLKEWMFFASFLLSSLMYVFVVATGNVQHDYYQIPIMPSVAIFFGIGSYFLLSWNIQKIPVGKILFVVCLVGFLFFSWQRVGDYFNINNRSMIAAGEAVDRLLPKDAKIIANYTGDSTFLYQTNRKGWASLTYDLPEMITLGANYLVLLEPKEIDMKFGESYYVVKHTKQYVIFDLNKKVGEAK